MRTFRLRWMMPALLAAALFASSIVLAAQSDASSPGSQSTYRLTLPVNEVSLTFHAADAHGMPVDDLKLDELSLLDNGKPPLRMINFSLLRDSPIRAGILVDTSQSMGQRVAASRAIALNLARNVLHPQSDLAFVMDFGYASRITQAWTGDPAALAGGIRRVVAGRVNPLGGTVIFDAIFRACFYQFGAIDHAASGNFILLTSDGEDNASHVTLQEAVGQCQRSNTVIYAFRAEPDPGFFSTGPRTLAELVAQTGGRVFNQEESAIDIEQDLRLIEADMRSQYRLVYNPAAIRPDGRFHRIELTGPDRVASLGVRSGYYAPAQ